MDLQILLQNLLYVQNYMLARSFRVFIHQSNAEDRFYAISVRVIFQDTGFGADTIKNLDRVSTSDSRLTPPGQACTGDCLP